MCGPLKKLERYLPGQVCFCCPFNIGLQILLFLAITLRLCGMVCGGFYGPYLYLVVSLGGLYISADLMVLYSVFWKGEKNQDCEYPTTKVWIRMWQGMNIIAVLGLLVAIGWYCNLGLWAMTHDPVHLVTFILLLVITPLLLYTPLIMAAVEVCIREQYIDGVLSKGERGGDEEEELTGGRRVSI